eukprot:gene33088-37389_t
MLSNTYDDLPDLVDVEEPAVVAPVVIAGAMVMPFEGVDPNTMLLLLRSVAAEDTINLKKFWTSYPKVWAELTPAQKTKAALFFEKNLPNKVREQLLEHARADILTESTAAAERRAMTNKNDKARAMHVMKDPAMKGNVSMALREKSRAELDDPNAPNYFQLIADAFNDYETYKYHNMALVPDSLTDKGTYRARDGMESIAAETWEINPTAKDRPLRDGGWIRTTWRDLRAKLSVCWANFKRSGQQDAENLFDEWCKFSKAFNNDVITYAYV